MTEIKKNKNEKGYVALVSMLILGAVGVAIATAVILRTTDTARSMISLEKSQKAKMLADACAEDALREIWKSESYAGTGSINLGDGSCTYSVSGTSIPKTINSTGTVGNVIRRVSVTIDSLHPYVNASLWKEVADF